MKSVFLLFTVLTSVCFGANDYFARKETITTNVLGQTSYTKHLDITLTGQVRLNVYETGKSALLDTKLYGSVDPRIMGKLRSAVSTLSQQPENNYSHKVVAVSGHESAISYLVLSNSGYITVQTQGGPISVHPEARTLSSAPFAIRDLLDAYDVLTDTQTYENPGVGPYCVSFNYDKTQAYVSGYVKSGNDNDFVLQSPGCAAIRVVTDPQTYRLEQLTLEATVPASFEKVKSYGYGLSLDGKFNEVTQTFVANRALVVSRIE